MSVMRQSEFIPWIRKRKRGLVVIIEDREGLGYQEYGVQNHAELINYMNPHDNCPWDAIIPGYDYKIPVNTRHLTRGLFGYINVPGGNHKIILDLKYEGFSYERLLNDIAKFVYYYNIKNDVEASVVLFNNSSL